ncbi:MAG: extracellular solute-binding protein [Betaproteobacteria bacterium]|nr:extracellular solute-binding protein [Betaproteobacteria bacterium]
MQKNLRVPVDGKSRRALLTASMALATAFGGVLPGSAAAQGAAASWPTVTSAAAKEGKVTLYHNLSPGGMEVLGQEFRKEFPAIEVELVRLGSAALSQRFATEYSAQRHIADVVVTTVDPSIFEGLAAGWAAAWAPPELAAYPKQVNYKGQNMLFHVLTVRDAIVWNKQRVRDADAPKEWADLFDSKWKGKVGMNPPWRSVTQQAIIAYWDKLALGDTAARMKANDVRFFEGSGGVLQAVIRGDVMVAQMLDLPLNSAIDDGAPIGFVYPKSGTTVSQVSAFVVSKAPHPNAARVLANWLLSVKGQTNLQIHGGLAGTRPGIPRLAHLPPTSSLSNVVDSLDLTPPAKQKEIVEHWRKTFGVQ